MTATRLKKVLRWIIGIVALLLLLAAGAVFFKDSLLKTITRWNIKAATGLEATIGKFNLDLGGSRLQITNFRIYNDPAFGKSALLDVPEIYLQFDPEKASQGKLHFKEVRFNLAELNVIRNTNGITNIEALKDVVERTTMPTNGLEFGGIDKLVLNLGQLNYTDLQRPENSTQMHFDVKDEVVRDLKTSEDVENWTMALLIRLTVRQAFLSHGRQSKTATFQKLLDYIN
jgi:uncharacterized protein involved in outer membrane biogenesis